MLDYLINNDYRYLFIIIIHIFDIFFLHNVAYVVVIIPTYYKAFIMKTILVIRKIIILSAMILILCTTASISTAQAINQNALEQANNQSERYIYNNPPSQQAKFNLALAFLARNDIWFKIRLKSYVEGKEPTIPLVLTDNLATRYEVQRTDVLNDEMLTISKRNRTNNRHILYLHGGAYVFTKVGVEPYEEALENMITYLGDRVTYLDYTGVRQNNYAVITSIARTAYTKLKTAYPNDDIILVGNSAGANLCLLLSQQLQQDNVINRPTKHILLSPWVDLSHENPDMKKYRFKDPILSIRGLDYAAKLFSDGRSTRDAKVSPLYGNFDDLGEIAIFVGTNDLVYPDSVRLFNKASKSGIRVHHYQYNKMMHDWMLSKTLPESIHAWEKAAEFINN